MNSSDFVWPTSKNYDFSMMNLSEMILDEEIRKGQVEMNEGNFGIRSMGGAKLYTTTYKISLPTPIDISSNDSYSEWVLRCFCTNYKDSPPDDILQRYQSISNFCINNYKDVPLLLPVFYQEKAIKVHYINDDTGIAEKTELLPLVKMPFIDAPSLGSFIAKNHTRKYYMRRLCVAWLDMVLQLEQIEMAHGDLDLTNVLVIQKDDDIQLKLIDYDNMWISTLEGLKQTEKGHDAFQHPTCKRLYNVEMDRFSALSIYISLRALAFLPHLYDTFKADDSHRLLFSKEDYLSVNKGDATNAILELRKHGILELVPYLDELEYSLRNNCTPCSLHAIPLPPIEIIGDYIPASNKQEQKKQPITIEDLQKMMAPEPEHSLHGSTTVFADQSNATHQKMLQVPPTSWHIEPSPLSPGAKRHFDRLPVQMFSSFRPIHWVILIAIFCLLLLAAFFIIHGVQAHPGKGTIDPLINSSFSISYLSTRRT